MTKKYNEIEAKNNMKVEADEVEVDVEVTVEPKKHVERVISVQPKKVKKSLLGRLVTGVMGPEGLPSIGTYVNDEIIKPAIKNLIFDAITSAASRAMFGDRGGPYRGNTRPSGNGGHRPATNYSNRFNNSRPSDSLVEERRTVRPARYGVEEYVIPDRYDASNVLVNLQEYADRYDKVSVADYYELIGVDSQFTDNNYGWTIDGISRASIMPVRGGYIIKFPPVEVI